MMVLGSRLSVLGSRFSFRNSCICYAHQFALTSLHNNIIHINFFVASKRQLLLLLQSFIANTTNQKLDLFPSYFVSLT